MDFKKEDMLDLSEENVKKVFTSCLATKDSSAPYKVEFVHETQNMKMPNIFFNKQNVIENISSIRYLLGQLSAVHKDDTYLMLLDGFKKYDGTNWTANKGTLFMLYYLGAAIKVLPLFKPFPAAKTLASSILGQTNLKPTLSPNDPNFKKKEGQEPADD